MRQDFSHTAYKRTGMIINYHYLMSFYFSYTLKWLHYEWQNTVAMQYGSEFWHCAHSRVVSSTGDEQNGQGDVFSSSSVFCGLRTMASIFFLYLSSIWPRVSGRISMAAKLNDEFLSPDRWHSMTVEVKMGTMSEMSCIPIITKIFSSC